MKEHPILFSASMVRAILEERKTQTRRPVKPQPGPDGLGDDVLPQEYGREWRDADCKIYRCPYGRPGDLLWVRETWAPVDYMQDGFEREDPVCIGYRANMSARCCEADGWVIDTRQWNWEHSSIRWRPSIHMPRWASRITLQVTDVRVQRVQEISCRDVLAEGFETGHDPAFLEFWNSAYAKHGLGWDVNPWVWVVNFERLQPSKSYP